LPSWQKLALASSGLVVLVLGITFLSHRTIPDERVSAPARVAVKPEKLETEAISVPIIETDRPPLKKTAAEEIPKLAKAVRSGRAPERDIIQNLEPMETEYVEYMMMGQDNRPVPIRLPKRIRMQYGLTSEDAFIRNVSH
jgi:hypothetical protein